MSKKKKERAIQQASHGKYSGRAMLVIKDSVSGSINWRHLLIIGILSFAVYSNTLFMDFALYDDVSQITENAKIKSLSNVVSFFTTEVWSGIRGATSSYYRPLFTLSLAVDYFFWGEQPLGYHLTNIVLHFFAVSALYFLGLKWLKHSSAALFAAVLFAVHPVHAEAVAWISGRNEMLTALFMFSSFYFYITYRQNNKVVNILLSLVLFFLALLSKEMAITLPLIILAYEFCYSSDKSFKKIFYPGMFVLSVIPYIIIRLAVVKDIGLSYTQPLLWRVSTSPSLIIENLKHLIFPFNLRVLYDIPIQKAFFRAEVLVPALFLLIIFSAIIMLLKSDRRAGFPFLFLFISMLPISGLPAIIQQPAPVADRYLYIPSAGFLIAAGYGFSVLTSLLGKDKLPEFCKKYHMLIALALIIASVFALLNFQRNFIWKDKLTLMQTMVKDAPNSAFAHYSLGIGYDSLGNLENAAKQFEKAIQIQPDYFEAHNNLGIVYDQLGRTEDALREYQNVLKSDPENIRVRNNLGILYEKKGDLDSALREYQAAVRLDPANVHAFTNLGLLYRKMNRLADSEKAFRAAVALKRNDPILHNNLGTVYFTQQSFDAAKNEFESAVALKPDYAEALNNLGLVYRRLQRYDDAIILFQKAITLNQRNAEAHNNLGIVYSTIGEIGKAVAEFEIAVRENPGNTLFRENLAKASKKKGLSQNQK